MGLHGWKTIRAGGAFDKHPLLIPAACLSAAWLPYAVIFARTSIAFGDLGSPAPFPEPLYWMLLALQLFVCVISHSLALRTIIGLYAPVWLILGSLAFFMLSPIWGMLTAADVRYPLFAMMVCVLTSSVAFIVYTPKPKAWLWVQLALASVLVCLLRSTGFWSVLPTLAGLLAFQAWRDMRDAKRAKEAWDTKEAKDDAASGPPGLGGSLGGKRLRLGAGTAAMASVLAVVCGTVAAAALLGWGEPLGEPAYGGVLVGHDVALSQVEHGSVFQGVATACADALVRFQELPAVSVTFSHAFYVGVFAVFLVATLARQDWRALLVGLPQLAIFALSLADPSHSTLAFVIPALAAQIMFFGAAMKGTTVIGRPPSRDMRAPREC